MKLQNFVGWIALNQEILLLNLSKVTCLLEVNMMWPAGGNSRHADHTSRSSKTTFRWIAHCAEFMHVFYSVSLALPILYIFLCVCMIVLIDFHLSLQFVARLVLRMHSVLICYCAKTSCNMILIKTSSASPTTRTGLNM